MRLMLSHEERIMELNQIIKKKDDRIDDLLQRLDNLVVAYQNKILLINQLTKTNTNKNEKNS